MQRQVEKLSRRLAEMNKRESQDHEKSNYRSIASFENPFQKHEQRRKPLNWDKYDIKIEIFVDSNYFMDWNQLSIYDVYFDEDKIK
jgi:hypothetical protein